MTTTVAEAAPEKKVFEKKKCVVCDNEIPHDAAKCPICTFPSNGTMCGNCGKLIPEKVDFCTKCNEFQNKRRFLPRIGTSFSLVLAFFAVSSGVFSAATYLSDRNSHTRFKVTGADAKSLHLKVWNTGRKPSRLVRFRLRVLHQVMIQDAPADDDPCISGSSTCPPPLYQAEGDAVIEAGKPVNVGLTVSELILTCIKPKHQGCYTKANVETLLSNHDQPLTVIVYVDVEESGHFWSLSDQPFVTHQADTVSVDSINEFILGRISAL